MARQTVTLAVCDSCGRSILPTNGGVPVYDILVRIDGDSLAGQLCEEHVAPIQEAANDLLQPQAPRRRRRTMDDSVVSDPSEIPIEEEE